MAKSKLTQKDLSRQETIHPYFPNDYEIIKKVNGSGKATYHHPNTEDDEVFTWENDLYSQMIVSLSRLQMLVGMVFNEAEELDRFYFLFEALMRDIRNQMDEMFEHVHNTLGVIEVEMVGSIDNSIYRSGMVLGVSLKPPEKATGGKVRQG